MKYTSISKIYSHLRIVGSIAIALSALCIGPANAQSSRVFAIGQPADIGDIPVGQFRSALESLPPQAQHRALETLRQGNVPIEDFVHMRVNQRGDVFFVDPVFEEDQAQIDASLSSETSNMTIDGALALHSKPGATNVLYLDFDGHVVQNSYWNSNSGKSSHPMRPYSRDTDYQNFSQSEIDVIVDSWRQVAEDLAPFDIDVTTEEPAQFGSNVGHVLVTQKQDADGDFIYDCSCGGVAYINVWGNPYGFPGLVFNTSLRGVAEAASHEFGHNLGLYHDGVENGSAYYSGHGSGSVSWAPIMGVGYYTDVVQWSRGEYPGANNTEDDLDKISAKLGYQTDDHEDVRLEMATPLVIVNGSDVNSLGRVTDPSWVSFENKGVIEDRNDYDLFSFDVGAGTIDLTVTPAHHEIYPGGNRGSNLDIEVTLIDEFGTVLQTSNPDLEIDASINYFAAEPGRYYLKIAGTGRGDPLGDGYTDYASIGQYHIHGTVAPSPVANNPPSAVTDLLAMQLGDVNIDLTWTDPAPYAPEDNEAGYRVLRSSNDGVSFSTVATLPADSMFYSDNNLATGQYIYKLELFNSAGTTASNVTEPIGIMAPMVAVATSESTPLGSIAGGSYLDTQTEQGSETIQEQHRGGKPNSRRSYLDHNWFITDVVPGAMVELHLSASAPANSDLDDFVFSYSVNGGPSNPIGTLVQGTTQVFTVALDPQISGTVTVNVVDSDPDTPGAGDADTVTIHEIAISSAGELGEQAPNVEIVTPTDATVVSGGTGLVFEAIADDFEDGDISAGISWSSNIDGYLGTGPSLSATLSGGTPGVTHVVTASVSDSASNASTASVTVHVDNTPTPTTVYIVDLDGAGASMAGGRWQASVTVKVLNDLGDPVEGAYVSGTWSNGANGSGNCTTNASGVCEISKGNLKNNVPSITYSVTNISGALSYDQGSNTDPEPDSDGTTITVAKP